MRKVFMNIAAVLLAGAALVACSVKENGSDTLGKKEIKFTASVGQFQTKADAADAASAVGLYVLNTRQEYYNERLEIVGNTLVPERPLYWDPEMYIEDIAQFVAYYPYNALRESIWDTFAVQKDQSTPEAYEASDLLVAVTQSAPVEGPVHLTFVHKFSRIIVTIDNLLDVRIKDVYLAGVCTETNKYETIYSDLSGDYESRADVKMLPILLEDGTPAWAVIIPHQDFEAALKVVTDSGEEYTIQGQGVYVRAGASYTASATLDGMSPYLVFSTEIAPWNDGWSEWFQNQGETPDDPSQDYWGLCGDITDWADGKDLIMERDEGYEYGYFITVELYKTQGFKFRKNNSWEEGDWGYDGSWDGTMHYIVEGENTLSSGGPDLYVPTSGGWYFWVDVQYGQVYASFLYEIEDPVDPEDPEEPFTGWSIIGSMNGEGWSTDHDLTYNKLGDGTEVYTISIGLAEGDEFKFRKDHGWEVNFGPDSYDNPYTFADHLLIESDESTWDVPEISLKQDGPNFRAPLSATWTFELYPDEALLVAYRVE
ncbi:MAG: fimbrillin family protein [Bacteroidales bacterium]|nr:fimbrillin family protein [Bacteroidales bacterium]